MSGVDFRITGVGELLASLAVLDEAGLRSLATQSMKRSLKGTVTAIRREAPQGPAPHTSAARGKRGRKGPLSRTVTVRTIRRRSGELVALQVGPRAWYKHFVIRGTAAHVITARDSEGVAAESADVRRINRFEAGGYTSDRANSRKALRLAKAARSRFVFRVQHPGARGNDFVARAARGQGEHIRHALIADLRVRVETAARAA